MHVAVTVRDVERVVEFIKALRELRRKFICWAGRRVRLWKRLSLQFNIPRE
jgi:hypothetical protein